MEGNALLRVSGLTMEARSRGGSREIVHNVDLTLNRGEVLGLIGESGAGKSTVGLATMGYVRPGVRITGGQVFFDGVDLTNAEPRTLENIRGRRIAYVAQSAAAAFNPFFKLTTQCAETAVRHGLKSWEQASDDAIALYRQMQLPDPDTIGFRYPHQVSGGQLQRAMTAMAMICRPDMIIFDEPTTALDVTTQIGVLASIRSIVAKYNTAAIYVSHDLAVVAQMADRILVMRSGNVVEEAPTRRMLTAPQKDYTKSLWAVRKLESPERQREPANKPLLSISGVGAHYGHFCAIPSITFDIPNGRTVSIVGESGSGKSTLAKVISGLLPASKGHIHFDGKMLPATYRHRSIDQLRAIQMVHQMPDTALNPKHTVEQIIGRPLSLYFGLQGLAQRTRIEELLRLLELEPSKYLTRNSMQLSGGEKQRVCIARALAADPKLVICDEVTSALDQIVARDILNLLLRIQHDTGITYLFITHDLTLVRAMSDEIVVMKNGEIVESGSRSSVLNSPKSPYTQELLSSAPEMDPDWLTRTLDNRMANPTK